jgi:hypothetical protein
LQGNQVRKKERKKNNRTAEALPRKKELEIDPSTDKGDQQLLFCQSSRSLHLVCWSKKMQP